LAARTALDKLLKEINTGADQQALPIPPRTRDRNKQMTTAAATTYMIARLVLGYALANDLDTLAGQVDFSPSELGHGRLTRRVQRMRQVLTAAKEHAAALADAGVTAEMLTDAEAKVAAAEAGISTPRSNIVKRQVATRNLDESFQKLERMFRYSLDPLMEKHRETDPDGYNRYIEARRVIDRPGHPTEDSDEESDASVKSTTATTTSQPSATGA
jgi:hypothetical protein